MTRRFGLRLVLAWTFLAALAYVFGDHYGRAVVPLYQHAVGWLAPEYHLERLDLKRQGAQRYFELRVVTARPISKGDAQVPAGVGASSSTLLGHALQHVILLYGLLLAWPVARWWQRALLLALGVPSLLVVELVDVPIVLVGSIEDLVLANLAPELLADSPRVLAMHFMNTGGRLALSLAVALLTIAAVSPLMGRGEGPPRART